LIASHAGWDASVLLPLQPSSSSGKQAGSWLVPTDVDEVESPAKIAAMSPLDHHYQALTRQLKEHSIIRSDLTEQQHYEARKEIQHDDSVDSQRSQPPLPQWA
jgi:hypothetical protein